MFAPMIKPAPVMVEAVSNAEEIAPGALLARRADRRHRECHRAAGLVQRFFVS
jgi:hypothetical protein